MSALTDYRTDRFKQRQIALLVTPSEYEEFVAYIHATLPDHANFSWNPDPVHENRACWFYRMANGAVVWHDPNDRNTPDDMPSMIIPFCLMGYKAPDLVVHPSQLTALRMCRCSIQSAAGALQDICSALNEIIGEMEG